MNRLSDLAGKVLLQSHVTLRNWTLFGTSTFTVRPNPTPHPPPALSAPLPALVFAVFLIRNTDKYRCALRASVMISLSCVYTEKM